jgi:oligoendopeptidase F
MDTAAKVPHRSEIPVEFTWDLTTMYPDDASWQQAIVQLEARLPEVIALQGRVCENSGSLLRALQLRDQVIQQLEKIHAYANQRRDSDSGDPAAQAIAERSGAVVARVQAALAFIEPEILGLSDETIRAWVEREPGLATYRFALEETARQRPHVRSAEVENVAALYTDVTRGPGEIFGMLTDVDLSFPAIQDDKGQAITLSHGRFRKYMKARIAGSGTTPSTPTTARSRT